MLLWRRDERAGGKYEAACATYDGVEGRGRSSFGESRIRTCATYDGVDGRGCGDIDRDFSLFTSDSTGGDIAGPDVDTSPTVTVPALPLETSGNPLETSEVGDDNTEAVVDTTGV
jgi:hypothetical protein